MNNEELAQLINDKSLSKKDIVNILREELMDVYYNIGYYSEKAKTIEEYINNL